MQLGRQHRLLAAQLIAAHAQRLERAPAAAHSASAGNRLGLTRLPRRRRALHRPLRLTRCRSRRCHRALLGRPRGADRRVGPRSRRVARLDQLAKGDGVCGEGDRPHPSRPPPAEPTRTPSPTPHPPTTGRSVRLARRRSALLRSGCEWLRRRRSPRGPTPRPPCTPNVPAAARRRLRAAARPATREDGRGPGARPRVAPPVLCLPAEPLNASSRPLNSSARLRARARACSRSPRCVGQQGIRVACSASSAVRRSNGIGRAVTEAPPPWFTRDGAPPPATSSVGRGGGPRRRRCSRPEGGAPRVRHRKRPNRAIRSPSPPPSVARAARSRIFLQRRRPPPGSGSAALVDGGRAPVRPPSASLRACAPKSRAVRSGRSLCASPFASGVGSTPRRATPAPPRPPPIAEPPPTTRPRRLTACCAGDCTRLLGRSRHSLYAGVDRGFADRPNRASAYSGGDERCPTTVCASPRLRFARLPRRCRRRKASAAASLRKTASRPPRRGLEGCGSPPPSPSAGSGEPASRPP